jgi:signal transduction histidine kinase
VVREAVARSERIVEGLLVLAQSDRALERTDPVDLTALTAGVIARMQDLAGRRQVTLILESTPITVPGHSELLERLIENLIDNATRYNHPDGWATVSLRAEPGSTPRAVLSVANSGPEVPAAMVEGLFEPFRRLGADRVDTAGGSGLGLSIVRSIALVHRGTVTGTALFGGGLRVDVILPTRQEPARTQTGQAQVPARSGL